MKEEKKCTKCGKIHNHYHIGFADGGKHFNECFECCSVQSCIEAREKGWVDDGHVLKPKEVK